MDYQKYLDYNHRGKRLFDLLSETINSDIICIQEYDIHIFQTFMSNNQPVTFPEAMKERGYTGILFA